jgi:hypothetical protein
VPMGMPVVAVPIVDAATPIAIAQPVLAQPVLVALSQPTQTAQVAEAVAMQAALARIKARRALWSSVSTMLFLNCVMWAIWYKGSSSSSVLHEFSYPCAAGTRPPHRPPHATSASPITTERVRTQVADVVHVWHAAISVCMGLLLPRPGAPWRSPGARFQCVALLSHQRA